MSDATARLMALNEADMRRALQFGSFLNQLCAPPAPPAVPQLMAPATTKRDRKRQHRAAVMSELRLRDGDGCWLCGKVVSVDQETLEHLDPLSRGGRNELANFALAHRRCNQMMGNLPLPEKEELRASFRSRASEPQS